MNVWLAAKTGDVVFIEQAISRGEDIHLQDAYGNSPFYYASLCGHADVLKALLDAGAQDDSTGRAYTNALSPTIHKLIRPDVHQSEELGRLIAVLTCTQRKEPSLKRRTFSSIPLVHAQKSEIGTKLLRT